MRACMQVTTSVCYLSVLHLYDLTVLTRYVVYGCALELLCRVKDCNHTSLPTSLAFAATLTCGPLPLLLTDIQI